MAPRKRLHSVKIFPTKSACFREEKKANDPSYATWSSVCSICTIVFLDTWVSFYKWAKRMASFEMRYAYTNQFISWISVRHQIPSRMYLTQEIKFIWVPDLWRQFHRIPRFLCHCHDNVNPAMWNPWLTNLTLVTLHIQMALIQISSSHNTNRRRLDLLTHCSSLCLTDIFSYPSTSGQLWIVMLIPIDSIFNICNRY